MSLFSSITSIDLQDINVLIDKYTTYYTGVSISALGLSFGIKPENICSFIIEAGLPDYSYSITCEHEHVELLTDLKPATIRHGSSIVDNIDQAIVDEANKSRIAVYSNNMQGFNRFGDNYFYLDGIMILAIIIKPYCLPEITRINLNYFPELKDINIMYSLSESAYLYLVLWILCKYRRVNTKSARSS
jgi:hypothetical protein